jgi:hypothetical protein
MAEVIASWLSNKSVVISSNYFTSIPLAFSIGRAGSFILSSSASKDISLIWIHPGD